MSNHLGQIYSTTKNAEKYIVLNSQNVELSGNVKLTNGNLEVSNNLIFNTVNIGNKINFKETNNNTEYNITNDKFNIKELPINNTTYQVNLSTTDDYNIYSSGNKLTYDNSYNILNIVGGTLASTFLNIYYNTTYAYDHAITFFNYFGLGENIIGGKNTKFYTDVSFNRDVDICGNLNINGGSIQINGDAGTTGQVLQSNGSSSLPSWQTPIQHTAYGTFRFFGLEIDSGNIETPTLAQVGTPVGMTLTGDIKRIKVNVDGDYIINYFVVLRQLGGTTTTNMNGKVRIKKNGSVFSEAWNKFNYRHVFSAQNQVSMVDEDEISFDMVASGAKIDINPSANTNFITIYKIR